jgi:hypothetical protein
LEFYSVECIDNGFGGFRPGDRIYNKVYEVPYTITFRAVIDSIQVADEYTGYTITTICNNC